MAKNPCPNKITIVVQWFSECGPVAPRSPGNLLGIQILVPYPRSTELGTWGQGCPAICVLKSLQDNPDTHLKLRAINLYQWLNSGVGFVPQKTFGNIWNSFSCYNLGMVMEETAPAGIWLVGARVQ